MTSRKPVSILRRAGQSQSDPHAKRDHLVGGSGVRRVRFAQEDSDAFSSPQIAPSGGLPANSPSLNEILSRMHSVLQSGSDGDKIVREEKETNLLDVLPPSPPFGPVNMKPPASLVHLPSKSTDLDGDDLSKRGGPTVVRKGDGLPPLFAREMSSEIKEPVFRSLEEARSEAEKVGFSIAPGPSDFLSRFQEDFQQRVDRFRREQLFRWGFKALQSHARVRRAGRLISEERRLSYLSLAFERWSWLGDGELKVRMVNEKRVIRTCLRVFARWRTMVPGLRRQRLARAFERRILLRHSLDAFIIACNVLRNAQLIADDVCRARVKRKVLLFWHSRVFLASEMAAELRAIRLGRLKRRALNTWRLEFEKGIAMRQRQLRIKQTVFEIWRLSCGASGMQNSHTCCTMLERTFGSKGHLFSAWSVGVQHERVLKAACYESWRARWKENRERRGVVFAHWVCIHKIKRNARQLQNSARLRHKRAVFDTWRKTAFTARAIRTVILARRSRSLEVMMWSWRRFAVRSTNSRRVAKELADKKRRLYFCLWLSAANRHFVAYIQESRVRSLRQDHLKREAVRRLLGAAREAIRKRVADRLLLAHLFLRFQRRLEAARQRKALICFAESSFRRRRCLKTIKEWRFQIDERKAARTVSDHCVELHHTYVRRAFFSRMQMYVGWRRDMYNKGLILYNRTAKARLRWSFVCLRNEYDRRQEITRKGGILRRRVARNSVRRAFRLWNRTAYRRHCITVAEGFVRERVFSKHFYMWIDQLDCVLNQRIAEGHERRAVSRKVLTRWTIFVKRQRSAREVTQRHRMILFEGLFRAWRLTQLRRVELRTRMDRMHGERLKISRGLVLEAWKLAYARRLRKRLLNRIAQENEVSLLHRKCFHGWSRVHARRAALRAIGMRLAELSARWARKDWFSAWKNRSGKIVRARMSEKFLKNERVFYWAQACFRAWRDQGLPAEAERKRKLDNASRHYAHKIQQVTFSFWRNEYVPARRLKRSKMCAARLHRENHVYGRVMLLWKAQSQESHGVVRPILHDIVTRASSCSNVTLYPESWFGDSQSWQTERLCFKAWKAHSEDLVLRRIRRQMADRFYAANLKMNVYRLWALGCLIAQRGADFQEKKFFYILLRWFRRRQRLRSLGRSVLLGRTRRLFNKWHGVAAQRVFGKTAAQAFCTARDMERRLAIWMLWRREVGVRVERAGCFGQVSQHHKKRVLRECWGIWLREQEKQRALERAVRNVAPLTVSRVNSFRVAFAWRTWRDELYRKNLINEDQRVEDLIFLTSYFVEWRNVVRNSKARLRNLHQLKCRNDDQTAKYFAVASVHRAAVFRRFFSLWRFTFAATRSLALSIEDQKQQGEQKELSKSVNSGIVDPVQKAGARRKTTKIPTTKAADHRASRVDTKVMPKVYPTTKRGRRGVSSHPVKKRTKPKSKAKVNVKAKRPARQSSSNDAAQRYRRALRLNLRRDVIDLDKTPVRQNRPLRTIGKEVRAVEEMKELSADSTPHVSTSQLSVSFNLSPDTPQRETVPPERVPFTGFDVPASNIDEYVADRVRISDGSAALRESMEEHVSDLLRHRGHVKFDIQEQIREPRVDSQTDTDKQPSSLSLSPGLSVTPTRTGAGLDLSAASLLRKHKESIARYRNNMRSVL